MDRNLDKIINNINYHTDIIKKKSSDNILATLGYISPKNELSQRQIDMLNYHINIESASLEEKIISAYSK